MLLFKKFTAFIILSGISFTSMALPDYSKLIIGKWQCELNDHVMGVTVNSYVDIEYFKDGTGAYNAIDSLVYEGLGLEMAFDINATQNWDVRGNILNEMVTDGEVTSLIPIDYEALDDFDFNDLLRKGYKSSSRIIEITSEKMRLTHNTSKVNCKR